MNTKSSKLTHLRIHLLQDFTTQNKRCIDLIGETNNFCNGRLPMLVAPQDTNKTKQFSKDIPKKSALHAMLHLQASSGKHKNRPPDTSSSGRLRRINDTSPCISIGGDKGWYRFKMFKYFKQMEPNQLQLNHLPNQSPIFLRRPAYYVWCVISKPYFPPKNAQNHLH